MSQSVLESHAHVIVVSSFSSNTAHVGIATTGRTHHAVIPAAAGHSGSLSRYSHGSLPAWKHCMHLSGIFM